MNITTLETPVTQKTPYLSFRAVIAGTIIALAITLVLIPFGNGLGLSISSPVKEENARWAVIVIGLWLMWVQIISSVAGGYFAGRSACVKTGVTTHETEFRDGVHGLLVWALSTILVMIGAAITGALTAWAAHHTDGAVTHEDMADYTKRSAIIFSFITAASSVVSAAAAWWMSVLGGEHRDKAVDFSHHISFRKRR